MYPRLLQDKILLSGTSYIKKDRSKPSRCILDSCRMKFSAQVLVIYCQDSRTIGQEQTFPMYPRLLKNEILLPGTSQLQQDRSKPFRCTLDSCRMKFFSQVLLMQKDRSKPFRCTLDSCRIKFFSQVLVGTSYIQQDRSKHFRSILASCRMKFSSKVLVIYSRIQSKPFLNIGIQNQGFKGYSFRVKLSTSKVCIQHKRKLFKVLI